jgi:hypothetical protein
MVAAIAASTVSTPKRSAYSSSRVSMSLVA